MRGTHWVAVLCVVGLLAAWGVGAYGAVWYVDISAAVGGDGTSWASAYTDLQSALGIAVSGDEIWVAEGVYKPTSPAGRDATFQLKDGVALYGGFSGTETLRSQRNWSSHETILSGDIGTEDDSWDNSYNVVTGSGTDDTAVLDGFTITAGNADGVNPHNYGGGMLIAPGSPIVSNCTFVGNTAGSGGGMAVAASEADPTLMNCTFRDNSTIQMPGTLSGGGGGGMVIFEYASVTVTYCSFDSNFGYFGGGICLDTYSSAVVTHCSFTGNTAGTGGGLCTNVSVVSLSNCTFSGNTAHYGGGMRGH